MKNIQVDDLERLAIELRMVTENSKDWAKRTGVPDDILNAVGETAIQSMVQSLANTARETLDPNDITPDEDGMIPVQIDIGGVVGRCCVAAFILGYETHKQYGSDDA